MFVAMGAKLLQFHSSCRVAAVFSSSISGYTIGSFVGIGTTFGAFQSDNDTYPFLASHNYFLYAYLYC
jgi:hypothetical protein